MRLRLGHSTNMSGADFNSRTKTLTVHLNGGSYAAKGVSKEDVLNLEGAPSHGNYFHQVLRKKYTFEKV